MNYCRKCGADIEDTYRNTVALWCKKHRKEVENELNGLHNEGFDYYFIYHKERVKDGSRGTLRGGE